MPEWGSHIYENGVKKINPVFSEVNQVKTSSLQPLVDMSNHIHNWEDNPLERENGWEGVICKQCGMGKRFPEGTLSVEDMRTSADNAD